MKDRILALLVGVMLFYFFIVVLPELHKIYFRQFVKEECLK